MSMVYIIINLFLLATCAVPTIDHGDFDSPCVEGGTQQEDIACTLNCDSGYQASPSSITCQDDGQWDDPSPVCLGKFDFKPDYQVIDVYNFQCSDVVYLSIDLTIHRSIYLM